MAALNQGYRCVSIGLLAIIWGCHRPESPAPVATEPIRASHSSADPWVLTCLNPRDPTPALLWDGKVGVRIGRDGTGIDSRNFPLTLLRIDNYQPAGFEKILPMANPLSVRLSCRGQTLDPAAGRDYSQSLDMRDGILRSGWSQRVGDVGLRCRVETMLDPTKTNLAVTWRIAASKTAGFELRTPYALTQARADLLRGRAKDEGGRPMTYQLTCPHARLTDAKAATFEIEPTTPVEIAWTVALAEPRAGHHKEAWPATANPDRIRRNCFYVWRKRWQTDIEIDGPRQDQQAVRSFLFYLRSALWPEGKMSISPFGLSDPGYDGHVFWDADMWVFPALALVDPDEATAIPTYRVRTMPVHPSGRMRFAWESSVSGRETSVGPPVHELHVSGDVAWSASIAAALGLEPPDSAETIRKCVANYYRSVASSQADGLGLTQVLSPDESVRVDNDLFTNLLAQWTINGGKWSGPAKFHLPHDEHLFLSYDDDRLRSYKQAAAILSLYPLQYPSAENKTGEMMDRFAGKVTPNGPAMGHSIDSIIRARAGEMRGAYDDWTACWRPYVEAPLMMFAEKPVGDRAYFVTGAAGALQSVLYGFFGIRIDYKRENGAVWSAPLRDGVRWISIKPNLPTAWKSIKFKNFTVLGRRYTLVANHGSASVIPER